MCKRNFDKSIDILEYTSDRRSLSNRLCFVLKGSDIFNICREVDSRATKLFMIKFLEWISLRNAIMRKEEPKGIVTCNPFWDYNDQGYLCK